MARLIFHPSHFLSLGAELELQLIDPETKALKPSAKDLIRRVSTSRFAEKIKPEVTQGMIELNSGIHMNPEDLYTDLFKTAAYITKEAKSLDTEVSGGGTHPFQQWAKNKVFPLARYRNVTHHYRYLSKTFTVFALHFHIGCRTGNDAIYLTHLLSKYIPHFIALSAASPFYQGGDTGCQSARINVVNAFPTSGHMPFFTSWHEFSDYYLKIRDLKIIHTMKDIYWDIRPKPTFGTIEVRICDMPLVIEKVAVIAAYAQALARYLLLEKPRLPIQDLYLVYNYNRFSACRYGLAGKIIDPYTLKQMTIAEDVLQTLKKLKPHASALNTSSYLDSIKTLVKKNFSDADLLKQIFAKKHSFEDVVKKQSSIWANQFKKV